MCSQRRGKAAAAQSGTQWRLNSKLSFESHVLSNFFFSFRFRDTYTGRPKPYSVLSCDISWVLGRTFF